MTAETTPTINLGPRLRAATGRRSRLMAVVLAAGLFLTACSSGPGTRDELVESLTRDGNFTEEQATCVATAVFDQYGSDEDALGKISATPDIETLDGEDGVPGFTDFFRGAVAECSPTGPVQG